MHELPVQIENICHSNIIPYVNIHDTWLHHCAEYENFCVNKCK